MRDKLETSKMSQGQFAVYAAYSITEILEIEHTERYAQVAESLCLTFFNSADLVDSGMMALAKSAIHELATDIRK